MDIKLIFFLVLIVNIPLKKINYEKNSRKTGFGNPAIQLHIHHRSTLLSSIDKAIVELRKVE